MCNTSFWMWPRVKKDIYILFREQSSSQGVGGGGGTPYNGLYREAPLERGTFFRLQVYERVGKSFIFVYKKAHDG